MVIYVLDPKLKSLLAFDPTFYPSTRPMSLGEQISYGQFAAIHAGSITLDPGDPDIALTRKSYTRELKLAVMNQRLNWVSLEQVYRLQMHRDAINITWQRRMKRIRTATARLLMVVTVGRQTLIIVMTIMRGVRVISWSRRAVTEY
jgi:hypothetical protein